MPFGLLLAERKQPRTHTKKEHSPREPKVKEIKQDRVEKPPIITEPSVDGIKFHILLIGRNLSVIQEFLCAMNLNMGESLSGEGLSYYTREAESVSDIVAKKKQLEQFFWSFSQEDWVCGEDEVHEKTYVFTISPSGNQSKAVDLVMHCVTPQSQTRFSWEKTDAVWLMTDGLLLDDGRDCDPYLRFAQDTLSNIPHSGDEELKKPICLVVSQMEALGHFQTNGTRSQLPDSVHEQLKGICQAFFTPVLHKGVNVSMIPVQVYGGMEYVCVDAKGDPVQHLGQNGFYQSYLPDNCQIPGLYTLQRLAAIRDMDFFVEQGDGGVVQKIRRIYAGKYGDARWEPVLLQGGNGL